MARKILAACDCETDPFDYDDSGYADLNIKPFIWGYFNGKTYKEFDSTEAFIDDAKRRPWDFYAHNGGKFDYMYLLDYMDDVQDIKIINGRISKFKIGRATFYDSFNILPVSLAKLEKQKFDYKKLKKSVRHLHEAEISSYLRSDCVNLYNSIQALFSKRKKKLTLASSAMSEFEAVVAKMPKSDSAYHDKFKEFYFGGRVTHFELGVIHATTEKPISIIDINSAYPFAMMQNHPYGTKMGRDVIERDCLPTDREDIENCFIELECFSDRALPRRPKKNGGIEFYKETNKFKITGWEYLAAIDTGTISDVKIIKVYHFVDCLDFSAYVEKFYAEKVAAELDNDTVGRMIAKLYLNSCYGKFGQDERKYKKYKIVEDMEAFRYILHGSIRDEIVDDVYKDECEYREEMIDMWELTREFENGMALIECHEDKTYTNDDGEKTDDYEFYNIATAASITGWVRAYMWRSLCSVERPLYCDTDSIACFGVGTLTLGRGLGEWDVEAASVSRMAIAGKKLYAAFSDDGTTKTASKGVQLSAEEIERVALGAEVEYRKMSPVYSVKQGMRQLSRFVNRQDKKDFNVNKRKNMEKKGCT